MCVHIVWTKGWHMTASSHFVCCQPISLNNTMWQDIRRREEQAGASPCVTVEGILVLAIVLG